MVRRGLVWGSQQGMAQGHPGLGSDPQGDYWRRKTRISPHCSLAQGRVSQTSKDGEGPARDRAGLQAQGVLTASCSPGSPGLSLGPGGVTTHGAPAAAVLASGESGAP